MLPMQFLKKRSENNGVFILFCLTEHFAPTVFRIIAIDNTDIKIDTPTGKHQFHGTAMAVFQQRQEILCVFKEDQKVIDQTFHYMMI